MVRRKTREQLESDVRVLKNSIRSGIVVKLGVTLIRCLTVVGIFYIMYLMVKELAGKDTVSNILVKFVTDFNINETIAYTVGGIGTLYGFGQRHLRRNYVSRYHRRIQELERQIDGRRSTSRLTDRGETRPEDR